MLEKYTFLADMGWRPENLCPLTFCTEHEELFGTSTQVLTESLQMRLILLLAASMRIGKSIQRLALLILSDSVCPLLLPKRQTNPPTGLLLPGPHPLAPSSTQVQVCLWTHLFLWTILFEYFFFQKSCLRTFLAVKANTESQGQEYN